jgi:hypothetical protein
LMIIAKSVDPVGQGVDVERHTRCELVAKCERTRISERRSGSVFDGRRNRASSRRGGGSTPQSNGQY